MLSSINDNSTVTSGTFCVASDCDKSISSWIDVQVILLLIFNCPCANDIDSSVVGRVTENLTAGGNDRIGLRPSHDSRREGETKPCRLDQEWSLWTLVNVSTNSTSLAFPMLKLMRSYIQHGAHLNLSMPVPSPSNLPYTWSKLDPSSQGIVPRLRRLLLLSAPKVRAHSFHWLVGNCSTK